MAEYFLGENLLPPLCHNAPRHRQEAHERTEHDEDRSRIGNKGDVLFQEVWKCFSSFEMMREIEGMGHEVGYHSRLLRKAKEDHGRAIKIFKYHF